MSIYPHWFSTGFLLALLAIGGGGLPSPRSTLPFTRGGDVGLHGGSRVASLFPLPDDPLSPDLADREAPNRSAPLSPTAIRTFAQALHHIRTEFHAPAPDKTTLTYAAIGGMMQSLGDRYSRFLDPIQYRRLQEENSGRFGGIGMSVTLNAKNEVIVSTVDADGPAKKAGLRAGDLLLRIDDHPIHANRRAAERAAGLFHGNPGTSVRLSIRRRGHRQPQLFTVTRRLAQNPTVTYRILNGRIGYLKLTSFGERSDEEVGSALRSLKTRRARALVLDLRGNPGGYFNAAVDIASRFIERGPVVQTGDRDNHRVAIPSIPSKRFSPRWPLVVLVDRWSASASEIVAAAIQDTGSGILIGQKTYGKALVQTINPIADGSALLLTTHHYYTPRGSDISHRGIRPDILLDDASAESANDIALQRAIAWLNSPAKPRLSTTRTPPPAGRSRP